MILDYNEQLKDVYIELKSIEKWINANRLDSNCRYLISYAVIKSCGTIEKISKNILYDYISDGTNDNAKAYFVKIIKEASFNPKFDTLKNKLANFNKEKSKDLSRDVKTEWKEDINSLVSLRNTFAHGQNINSSINDIIKYYKNSVEILNILNIILDSEYENEEVLTQKSFENWENNCDLGETKYYINKMYNIRVSVYNNRTIFDEKMFFYKTINSYNINFIPKMICYDSNCLAICTENLFGYSIDEHLKLEFGNIDREEFYKSIIDKFEQLIEIGFICKEYKKEDIIILNNEERNIIINTDNFIYKNKPNSKLVLQDIKYIFSDNTV